MRAPKKPALHLSATERKELRFDMETNGSSRAEAERATLVARVVDDCIDAADRFPFDGISTTIERLEKVIETLQILDRWYSSAQIEATTKGRAS